MNRREKGLENKETKDCIQSADKVAIKQESDVGIIPVKRHSSISSVINRSKEITKANVVKPSHSTSSKSNDVDTCSFMNNDAKNFVKKFNDCIVSLKVNIKDYPWIDYYQMRNIMMKLGFVVTHSKDKEVYKNLIIKVFNTLDVLNKGKININDLKEFLIDIINTPHGTKVEYRDLYYIYRTYNDYPKLLGEQKGVLFDNLKKHYTGFKTCIESINRYNKTEESKKLGKSSCKNLDYKRNTSYSIRSKSESKSDMLLPTKKARKKLNFGTRNALISKIREEQPQTMNISNISIDVSNLIEPKEPILNISLNLKNSVETLVVYKGDTPHMIAKSFANKHSKLKYNE